MFGSMGRRAVEAVVGLFALLGFAFVPLGSKTGLEHAIALAATPTAKEAVGGLIATIGRARELVVRALAQPTVESTPLPLPTSSAKSSISPRVPALPAKARATSSP